jgi:polysaccharide pyruvyl transferase WcaK-like protein
VRVFGRDQATVSRLGGLGVRASLGSDLAFRSPAASRLRADATPRAGLVIAVAPRQFGWDSEAYPVRDEIAAATAGAITILVREHNARVLVVTQSSAADLEHDPDAIDQLLPMLSPDARAVTELLPTADRIEDAIDQYARADIVLAYRLHAGILALRAGTPSLVIDYEPKVRGVLGMVDLQHWVLTPREASDDRCIVDRLIALQQSAEADRIRRAVRIAESLAAPFDAELARRFRGAGSQSVPGR